MHLRSGLVSKCRGHHHNNYVNNNYVNNSSWGVNLVINVNDIIIVNDNNNYSDYNNECSIQLGSIYGMDSKDCPTFTKSNANQWLP